MNSKSTASQGQALALGTGAREGSREREGQPLCELVEIGLRAAEHQSDGSRAAMPLRSAAGAELVATDTSTGQVSRDLRNVYVPRPVLFEPSESFRLLAKWEGIVDEVFQDGFTAELHDVHGSDDPKTAEFDLEDINLHDRALIRPGAVFYWSIGYRRSVSGQQERSSSIYVRRLLARRQLSGSQVRHEAQRIAQRAGWNGLNREAPDRAK